MSTNPFLSVDYTDFNRIKDNFKNYLKSQTVFQDYDFEGSNINVLLDILAYNTYYNAHYLNMVGSEMFLDSAQLKESIVSHAKELNYLPRSRKSAEAIVTFEPSFVSSNVDKLIIPETQKITAIAPSTIGESLNLNFYPLEPIVLLPDSQGNFISNEIKIYQGNLVEDFFDVVIENENYITEFILSSENADISTIVVDVFDSPSNLNTNIFRRYQRANSLFDLNPNSEVFFIQGYRKNRYQIYFGNDVTGKKLSTGNVVRIRYLSTLGENGNNIGNFTPFVANGITYEITTVTNSRYGQERETIDKIKFNAPRHFETQERAVTASDYETLVLQNFFAIQAAKAFGGEKLTPKRYGKVAIACKPFGTEALINNSYKRQIEEYLKLKNLTSEPIVVDPEYFYIEINCNVYFDKNLLKTNLRNLQTNIVNEIINLNENTFNDFGKDLYYSRLIEKINNVDESILTNDLSLRMIKIWRPTRNENSVLKFSYDNSIFNYTLLENSNLFSEFPSSFQSSSFTYIKRNGDRVEAFLRDDSKGNIFLYEILENGNENIIQKNIGTINYRTGAVEITAQIADYLNEIKLYAKTLDKNILVNNNKFLIAKGNDITVELINRNQLDM